IEARVGLFVEFPDALADLVCGAIAANYPNCTLATVRCFDPCPSKWSTWSAELRLSPEVFPLLRHAQFEDLLNGNFADPITGILRAVTPADQLCSRVEIRIAPARHQRRRTARNAIWLLDREFFRVHHRLAEY